MNLLLVYLKMAIERTPHTQWGTLPQQLLVNISQRPSPQQATLFHLITPLLVAWSKYRHSYVHCETSLTDPPAYPAPPPSL